MKPQLSVSDRFTLELTDSLLDLNRLSVATRSRVASMLRQLEGEIARAVRAADMGVASSIAGRTRRAERAIREAEKAIRLRFKQIEARITTGKLSVAAGAAKDAAAATNKVFGKGSVRLLSKKRTRGIAKDELVLGESTKDWLEATRMSLVRSLRRELRMAAKRQAEGTDEVLLRVRGKPTGRTLEVKFSTGKTTRLREHRGGVLDVARNQADTLIRDALQTVIQATWMATVEGVDGAIGWAAVTVRDDRTSKICMARTGARWFLNGKPMPGSTRKEPFPGPPPWHFNAVVAGGVVETATGDKPIESVVVGDLVRTHTSKFGRVYATMGKLVNCDVLRIHSDSGGVLEVTKEHPVFVADRGWIQAGDLQVGDQLFQKAQKGVRCFDRSLVHQLVADNRPAGFDEEFIPDFYSLGLQVPAVPGIQLNVDFARKLEVKDEPALVGLEKHTGRVFENLEEDRLTPIRVLSEKISPLGHDPLPGGHIKHGIALPHPSGTLSRQPFGRQGLSEPPVVHAGQFPTGVQRLEIDGRALLLSPSADSKLPAPDAELSVAQSKLPFQSAKGYPTFPEMPVFDECLERVEGSEFVGWVHATIIGVDSFHFNGHVYNLGVAADETYTVGGVVVHNCRSDLTVLTKESAGRLRIQKFDDWLLERGDEFARKKLGPGLFDLWKAGKITLAQLIDNAGNPLTIKELAQR